MKRYDELKENLIVDEDFFRDSGNNGWYYNLNQYPVKSNEIKKYLKSIGITKVKPTTEEKYFKNDLVLAFDLVNGTDYNASNKLTLTDLSAINKNNNIYLHYYHLVDDKDVVELKYLGKIIGHYYKKRNIVNCFISPIGLVDYSTENAVLDTIKILKEIFDKVKLVKVDTSDLVYEELVSNLLKNIDTNLKNSINNLNQNKNTISDLDKDIINLFRTNKELEQDIVRLSTVKQKGNESIKDEIKKVEKLKFIKQIDVKDGTLKVTFVPTFITVDNFKTHDMGKTFGKRIFYLGEVEVSIKDTFKVTSKLPGLSHGHPHASDTGNPCLGDNGLREKLVNVISSIDLVGAVTMIWFWINSYRSDHAHVRMWTLYNMYLENGLPVFDEKGKRIEINEPDRIKSEEQTTLNKSTKYESNIKKFKDVTYGGK